jgi:hypothetical protein
LAQIACLSAGVPSTAVYLVSPARMARMPASLMLSGVSKSGSPAPRPMTSRPAALSSRAFWVTAMVGDGLMRDRRWAMKDMAGLPRKVCEKAARPYPQAGGRASRSRFPQRSGGRGAGPAAILPVYPGSGVSVSPMVPVEELADLAFTLALGALFALGLMLYAMAHDLRPTKAAKDSGDASRRKLRRTLDALDHPSHHDVRIVDQQGRIVRVEHLVCLPASVVLVGLAAKEAQGELVGSEYHRHWRISRGGRTTTCVNPLLELEPLARAFRRRFPLVRIRAVVVFPDGISFPEGPPRGAVRVSEFDRRINEMLKVDGIRSRAVAAAWPQIDALVASSRARIDRARKTGRISGRARAAAAQAGRR